jgi:hypothetical protein
MSHSESRLEDAAVAVSRTLAAHISRRSFITRIGQGAAFTLLGGAGAAFFGRPAYADGPPPPNTGEVALDSPAAIAADPSCDCGSTCIGAPDRNCCAQHTITCVGLGYPAGSCPSGTCGCGSWTNPDSSCGTPNNLRVWTDCCGSCNAGANCQCILKSGLYYPTCCRTKCYSGGCYLCADVPYIKCRYSVCV